MNAIDLLARWNGVCCGKNAIHALGGFLIAPVEQVTIGVHGELDRGVTETLGNFLSIHAFCDQKRGVRVAEVVETDPRKLVRL
jgi:hypothetical protein